MRHSHGGQTWRLRARTLTQDELAAVLLKTVPTARPVGAWTCGVVVTMAVAFGKLPDRQLIEDALKAPGPDPADTSYVGNIFEAWKIRHGGRG